MLKLCGNYNKILLFFIFFNSSNWNILNKIFMSRIGTLQCYLQSFISRTGHIWPTFKWDALRTYTNMQYTHPDTLRTYNMQYTQPDALKTYNNMQYTQRDALRTYNNMQYTQPDALRAYNNMQYTRPGALRAYNNMQYTQPYTVCLSVSFD